MTDHNPESRPDPHPTLGQYLTHLRRAEGDPSLRTLADAVGTSHTFVNDLLHDRMTKPGWQRVAAIVRHLGGDPDYARDLWARPLDAVAAQPAEDPVAALLRSVDGRLADITGLLQRLVPDHRHSTAYRAPRSDPAMTDPDPASDPASAEPYAEDWFAHPGGPLAHYVWTAAGDTSRVLCTGTDADVAVMRAAEAGDMPCPSCVAEMREAATDLNLPMPVCLGCGTMHPATETGLVAPHGPEQKPVPTCMGAGHRPAQFDGRDDTRREALADHTALRHNVAARRAMFQRDVGRDQPMAIAVDTYPEEIIRMETMLSHWAEVVASGDYMPTVRLAMIKSVSRRTARSGMSGVVDQATIEGSQDWLRAVRWRLLPVLGLPLADGQPRTAASELFEVLSVL